MTGSSKLNIMIINSMIYLAFLTKLSIDKIRKPQISSMK
nr:MAG TPA: hypothetical protein [Caudoviricetes sp.]